MEFLIGALALVGLVKVLTESMEMAISKFVSQTPSKKDDIWLEKAKQNKFYSLFKSLLKLVTSINLDKK